MHDRDGARRGSNRIQQRCVHSSVPRQVLEEHRSMGLNEDLVSDPAGLDAARMHARMHAIPRVPVGRQPGRSSFFRGQRAA